ncbi:hypothetical protein A2U01_0084042, partial [Trifolium medium]|nr:hypothetical protein [Trifolium medium]
EASKGFRGSKAVKPLRFPGSEAVKPLKVSEVLKYRSL